MKETVHWFHFTEDGISITKDNKSPSIQTDDLIETVGINNIMCFPLYITKGINQPVCVIIVVNKPLDQDNIKYVSYDDLNKMLDKDDLDIVNIAVDIYVHDMKEPKQVLYELIKELEYSKKSIDNIEYLHLYLVNKKKEITSIDQIDVTDIYDSGYGTQHLHGYVLFKDGAWLSRYEYDGDEWWELKFAPTKERIAEHIEFIKEHYS